MSEDSSQIRKAPRIPLSVSVKVTGLDTANTAFTEIMRTKNVSKIGAFLITNRLVPIGTVLKIENSGPRFVTNEEILAKVASILPKMKIAGIGIKIIKGQEAWKELITSL